MERLHLECLADERLVKNLGYSRKEIRHHNDKGRVCYNLQKQTGMLGMIDEDPNSAQPSYLRSLKQVSYAHRVKLLQDDTTGNHLIVLCPRLEEWVIEVCDLNNVDITGYGLSNTGNALHREINERLVSFDKLLAHLINDKQAPQLKHLKQLLSN